MTQTTLLLLSGGSIIGQNILDVLSERRQNIRLIATNSDPEALPLADFDKVYLSPTTLQNTESLEPLLIDIIQHESPDLVIPCRDDDVLFLAEFKEKHPELKTQYLCGNVDTARAVVDKNRSYEFAQKYHLPLAPSVPTGDSQAALAFAKDHGYPLLAKPHMGFASRGIYFVLNQDQLLKASAQEDYLLQQYLGDPQDIFDYMNHLHSTGIPLYKSFEGLKHSIQIFISPEGELVDSICTCNVNRFGNSLAKDRVADADAYALAETCARAFASAGWRGPMNIQCQRKPDGTLGIYEFNGRIAGATVARFLMGFDEIRYVFETFLKRNLPAAPGKTGQRVKGRWQDQLVNQTFADQLKQKGLWSAGSELKSV